MNTLDDKKFVNELRKDNEDAFDKIFNYYFPRLLSFAIEYVRDKEVAREIVQDTFLKLWEIRNQLAPDTRLAALLFTITRNDALNYLKQLIHKQKYIDNQKQFFENQLNYMALRDESSEKLMHQELENKINETIENLPEKCRNTFRLSRVEGLKYSQIAEKMGVSVKTVETHISEALKKIRHALNDFS